MKSKKPMLKLSQGEPRWEQKKEVAEALKQLRELHLELMGKAEVAPMQFVKMAAYRANTQRVFALLHDDAQEVWVDLFSVSDDGRSFFAATNAPAPLIGL